MIVDREVQILCHVRQKKLHLLHVIRNLAREEPISGSQKFMKRRLEKLAEAQ